MLCPHCGATNPDGAKFCEQCGADLSAGPRICPSCGASNSASANFCTACGTRLSPSQSEAAAPTNPVESPRAPPLPTTPAERPSAPSPPIRPSISGSRADAPYSPPKQPDARRPFDGSFWMRRGIACLFWLAALYFVIRGFSDVPSTPQLMSCQLHDPHPENCTQMLSNASKADFGWAVPLVFIGYLCWPKRRTR